VSVFDLLQNTEIMAYVCKLMQILQYKDLRKMPTVRYDNNGLKQNISCGIFHLGVVRP